MLETLRTKVQVVALEGRSILEAAEVLRAIVTYDKKKLRVGVRALVENYHAWFTGARPLVRGNLPDCSDSFEAMYELASESLKLVFDGINDLNEFQLHLFEQHLATQTGIVRSIPEALESKALGMRGILARDLFEDELTAARHLVGNGYVREAGVISAVVLERHLRLMCEKRGIQLSGKEMLGDLNNKLRQSYPDDSEFRRVQWMSEIRASCTHDKGPEPDASRVGQLITTVKDFIVTIS